MKSTQAPSHQSRILGAWWGLFIGDALALPYDGYVNLTKLKEDYPPPHDYLAPKDRHPHSDINRSPTREHPPENDYLHHRRIKWDEPGTHFHHGLAAGDNSFEAELAIHLEEFLRNQESTPTCEWADQIRKTLLNPKGIKDFYIPKEYRSLIATPGTQREGHASASDEIGPIITASSILLTLANDPDARIRELSKIFGTTGHSAALVRAANLYGEILRWILAGLSPDDACYKKLGHHHHPYMIYPYHRWIAHKTDEEVATHELNQCAAADNALPLSIFLTLKYADNFEKAIQANAALGGSACHRGALIGMLLGAHHGCEGIPSRFVNGLTEHSAIDKTGDDIWATIQSKSLTTR